MVSTNRDEEDTMAGPPSDDDFAELVHASWAALYRTAYLLVGDHGIAEDLVQTSLVKTYAAWSRVREPAAAHAYARTALVNTATSWFRLRGWRAELPSDRLPEEARDTDLSDRPALMDALAALPPRQRAVIVLRYFEDLDVATTARALGCAEGTVKSQTSDALSTLRRLLGDAVVPDTLGAHHD
jgi:RNA polymerase sigma-70 factor (sigma-E family)